MDAFEAIDLGRSCLLTALKIVAPILLLGLSVGVSVALFQAVTSLQEQTLTMVPKILAVGAAIFYLMPWILTQLADFARDLLVHLAHFGGAA